MMHTEAVEPTLDNLPDDTLVSVSVGSLKAQAALLTLIPGDEVK